MRVKFAVASIVIIPLLLSVAFPLTSAGQVNLQVQVGVPTIRFETPPVLVEVSPGVQVVPEYDQEVFFVDGWYWHRVGRVWYHTRDHRGGWVVAHGREVPRGLVRIRPGMYRHYRAAGGPHEHRREMREHRGAAPFQRREHDEHRGHFARERAEHNDRGHFEQRAPAHMEHGGHGGGRHR
jgi:hypothetical protein